MSFAYSVLFVNAIASAFHSDDLVQYMRIPIYCYGLPEVLEADFFYNKQLFLQNMRLSLLGSPELSSETVYISIICHGSK
ncbi:hypothetical protein [Coleofasciculus sp. FACHB-1120]|uniref:hypothetical protein n=1 Tax=Coleofasciculus sp. FACHB-1120 TaxID=2692783 RepID=UPI0016837AB8|nr:hypothetical protein [Coleofasciculus sp. FACHB-1120]MBD2744259.1 hypothetical protein [Coleofasciculus sp. FACHB-1120]